MLNYQRYKRVPVAVSYTHLDVYKRQLHHQLIAVGDCVDGYIESHRRNVLHVEFDQFLIVCLSFLDVCLLYTSRCV